MAGAEPQSWAGGPNGVLVLHGFTGNPQSLRSLAGRFAAEGHAVELPLLPGHGTALEDMLDTGWSDWSAAAEAAYTELAARCEKVLVAALSMGGTLAVWLAARHPEIAGLVLVNPATLPPAEGMHDLIKGMVDAGTELMDGIASDVAKEGSRELAYDKTPLRPLLSLLEAAPTIDAGLADVRCPILLFTSTQDHVVSPEASDHLARNVSGPVERITLERSFHVATIDHDQDEIEARAIEFAAKVFAG
jgi:carboxylesterase